MPAVPRETEVCTSRTALLGSSSARALGSARLPALPHLHAEPSRAELTEKTEPSSRAREKLAYLGQVTQFAYCEYKMSMQIIFFSMMTVDNGPIALI